MCRKQLGFSFLRLLEVSCVEKSLGFCFSDYKKFRVEKKLGFSFLELYEASCVGKSLGFVSRIMRN